MRNPIRTSTRQLLRGTPNRHRVGDHHRGHHHRFADPHLRSMAELELIAGHHRDAAPAASPGPAASPVGAAREQSACGGEMIAELRW
jgi:hypothetical protein